MTRGRFITLEGGEGAGKSTNARFIKAWLEQRGREVVMTREPGGSPLAEAIRGVVLASWSEGMPPLTEALLMFAARSAHLQATVLPALEAGKDVICDRFVDSSYAYQGAGNGFSLSKLQALEEMVLGDFRPDLTIVFDLDPSAGLQRARSRGDVNRFEDETVAFMQRVREAFLQRAKAEPARYAILNAENELETVQADLSKILESRV
ncbi:MAG: dTMP kinase [Pseudomonadota bacterium]